VRALLNVEMKKDVPLPPLEGKLAQLPSCAADSSLNDSKYSVLPPQANLTPVWSDLIPE
jgi:hypothetical protein